MENMQKCYIFIIKEENDKSLMIEIPFFEGFQVGNKIRIDDPNNEDIFNNTHRVSIKEVEHHYYYNNNKTIFIHEIRVIAS